VLAALATGGLRPDAIVFLDIPIDVGLERVQGRERGRMDKIEGLSRAFHERVLATYRMLIDQEPSRWIQVNGLGPPDVVADRVWKAMEAHGHVPAGVLR
jgi:dTMP kinase